MKLRFTKKETTITDAMLFPHLKQRRRGQVLTEYWHDLSVSLSKKTCSGLNRGLLDLSTCAPSSLMPRRTSQVFKVQK